MPEIKVKQLFHLTRPEIGRLFKTARRIARFTAFDFLAAPQTGVTGRLLLVASAKTGSAPERNKAKRRFRSIFYETRLFERGYDCIVICKKECISLDFDQLKELFLSCFEKLKAREEKTRSHESPNPR